VHASRFENFSRGGEKKRSRGEEVKGFLPLKEEGGKDRRGG